MNTQIDKIMATLAKILKADKCYLVTAESCTGGLISACLTDVSGSSTWFDRAYITYSNDAKAQMLGVSYQTLDKFGAVSEQTVLEMAKGALLKDKRSMSVAVSGIAGPDGGTTNKPVGTVWVAWCLQGESATAKEFLFNGDRKAIREQTVIAALQGVLDRMAC